ncbi:5-methylcytosine-specific restriction protein A [Variovorax sp. OAS795]|uniref:HNH endonuclease n=1 Tax=Variovorax sp. OAS795 TaxID=3034231 RepID=UPI003393AAAB
MLLGKKDLIIQALQQGTGAAIDAALTHGGLRTGIRIWFGDLDEKHGPVAELRPYGLAGYRVELTFGGYSRPVIDKIRSASPEDVQLARALVESIRSDVEVQIPNQELSHWTVDHGAFRMIATIRLKDQSSEDVALVKTCNDVIVPIMAAMAELIGYDVIAESTQDESPAIEGAILQSVVNRRERNPRNRLLCIRIHGERCAVCDIEPQRIYGSAGDIIEVHHLEPLALTTTPRPYDPRIDLVPVCPSCHRALHTRRPVPLSLEELKVLVESPDG